MINDASLSEIAIKKLFSRTEKIIIAVLVAGIGLAFIVPKEFCFENGPVENFQAILLLGYTIWLFYWSKNEAEPDLKLMWRGAALVFFLFFWRELSWGRVFFPTGMGEDGPTFIAMRDVPYHQAIHALIGLVIVAALYSIIRYTPWKAIRQKIPFPWSAFLLTVICVVTVDGSEHHLKPYLGEITSANLEELAEVAMYAMFIQFAEYYRLWFRFLHRQGR